MAHELEKIHAAGDESAPFLRRNHREKERRGETERDMYYEFEAYQNGVVTGYHCTATAPRCLPAMPTAAATTEYVKKRYIL